MYINDRWRGRINEFKLKEDWQVVSIYPIATSIGEFGRIKCSCDDYFDVDDGSD